MTPQLALVPDDGTMHDFSVLTAEGEADEVVAATDPAAPSPAPISVDAEGEPDAAGLPAVPEGIPDFVCLGNDWDMDDPERLPDLVKVAGGLPLLYSGESHMMFGKGGIGKSWLSYLIVLSAIRAGLRAIVIDYESNKGTVKRRMKALGMTNAEADRLTYWKIAHSQLPNHRARIALDGWLASGPPAFILLDSVSVACGASNLDDEKNPHYNQWFANVVEPWTMARHTTLLIDHLGHVEGRGRAIPAARGASSKVQRCSGASYWLSVATPWTKDQDGRGTLWTAKDREGNRPMGVPAVEMFVKSGCGRVEFTLSELKPAEMNDRGTKKRDHYNRMVSMFVQSCEKPPTQRKIIEHVRENGGSSTGYASDAIKFLLEGGYRAEDRKEGRQAIFYKHLEAYAEGDAF